jgi:peptide/nickel transport system substrate-binding protein
MLSQFGETLVFSAPDLTAQPLLAESWSNNADGTIWTFKLRHSVKFYNGKTMTPMT